MLLASSCARPRPAEIENGEREVQSEHHDRDRGTVPDGERLERGVEGVERNDFGVDAGPTIGERLDHDERPEGRHGDGEQGERRDRPKAREGGVRETAPRVGAIDAGGFVNVRWDRLESAEKDDHGEGGAPPDIGDDHGRHRNDPSQSTGLAPSPLRKTWFSDPKKKSYIATHRNPAISVGLTQASRTAP